MICNSGAAGACSIQEEAYFHSLRSFGTANPKPKTRNPKPETRNPKLETRTKKTKSQTRNLKSRSPKPAPKFPGNPEPRTRNSTLESNNPKPDGHIHSLDRRRGGPRTPSLPRSRSAGVLNPTPYTPPYTLHPKP